MTCTSRDRNRGRPARRRAHVIAVVALVSVAAVACSDDTDDAAPEPTVAVDEDFPGDALDAACARLNAGAASSEAADQEEAARALLAELIQLGDTELAVNTLEQAVIDRCPEWSDAVTAATDAVDGDS